MVGCTMDWKAGSRFAGVIAVAITAGCGSPQMSRIDKNRELYESWPLEMRQAVLDGKIEIGMTPDMVKVVLGKPAEIVTRSGVANSGDDEIWVYRKGGYDDAGMMGPGPMMGGGMGSVTVGAGSGGIGPILGTSIGTGATIGAGPVTIGAGPVSIGNAGMSGATSPVYYPPAHTPLQEREIVFRNGVVYRADPPI
jgi:hypothetical protein